MAGSGTAIAPAASGFTGADHGGFRPRSAGIRGCFVFRWIGLIAHSRTGFAAGLVRSRLLDGLFRGLRLQDFSLGLGRHRAAGPGKGVNALGSATTTGCLTPAFTAPVIPFSAAPDSGGALGGLGPLLGHQVLKLASFELLGKGAQGEAQHGNGGAEPKGLLQGPGRLKFVVTQPDPEAAGIALPTRALSPVPLPDFPRGSLPTTASRILGSTVVQGSVGVVSHARSTHSGASVAHRATGMIRLGVKPVQGVLTGGGKPLPGQYQQRQGAALLAEKALAVLLHKGQVTLQRPALISPFLGLPEALQRLSAGIATEFLPAQLLGLPFLQSGRQQLPVAGQFGRLAAGIRRESAGQLINPHAVQSQPAAVQQQHRQTSMPALLVLQQGETTVQLLPLARSQAHQGIHHQPWSRELGL